MRENTVKRVCRELGITQAKLARMLDVTPQNVSDWHKKSIPKMTEKALILLLENVSLRKNIKSIIQSQEAFENLRKILECTEY